MNRAPSQLSFITAAVFAASLISAAPRAYGQGGSRPAPPPPQPKAAVLVRSIADRHIEMPAVDIGPDRTLVYAYGKNISNRVITRLFEDNQVRVITVPSENESALQSSRHASTATTAASAPAGGHEHPDPVRLDDPVTAGLELSGEVKELSFDTGEKGDLTYYGFRYGFTNPYNDGTDARSRDEYAGYKLTKAFDDTGGLHDGMDLGSEVNIDVMWVGVSLKRARYSAHIGVDLQIVDALTGSTRVKRITGHGEGLFFELVAQYAGYMGGIVAARRAAMLDAFSRVTDTLAATIAEEAKAAALVFYGRWRGGALYIAGGQSDAALVMGMRFYNRSAFDRGQAVATVIVEEVFREVSRLSMPRGGAVLEGDVLVSLKAGEEPPRPVVARASQAASSTSNSIISGAGAAVSTPASLTVEAGQRDLDPIQEMLQFLDDTIGRFFRGLWALITLPARLSRFMQYDQSFNGAEMGQGLTAQRLALTARASWALGAIGLPQAWDRLGHGNLTTIVAVVDSGVDYNHEALRRNIFFDSAWESPGYDFFSGDKRPFDDHAHGTAVASAIAGGGAQTAGVAPFATILSSKVVSPYGYTRSAALYEGVRYALNRGAKIIVVGWATARGSEALYEALLLASERDALIVAAAGDDGVDLANEPRYPASYAAEDPRLAEHMVVVAGHGRDGQCFANQGTLRLSSNHGGPVVLGAPGSDVNSASPRNEYKVAHHSGIAAGFAAGAAALIWGRHADWTSAQVRAALVGAVEAPTSGASVPCGPRLRVDRIAP